MPMRLPLQLARTSLLLLGVHCAVVATAAAHASSISSTDESAPTLGFPHVHANDRAAAAADGNMTSAVFDAPADQARWLDRHNWLRSDGLVYPAANMAQLTWDFTLAAEARAAIASCTQQPQETHGLHVYVDSTPGRALDASLIEDAIAAWGLRELDGLIPQLETPQKEGDAVGKGLASRYAQLVSAATTRVGCAYTLCAHGRLAACKYSPVSTTTLEHGWYTYGSSCSRCGATTPALSSCTGKLCSSRTSSPIAVSLAAHELAARAYLPHKVRSLQLALDTIVQRQQQQQVGGARTTALALSTGGTNAVGTLCNGTATATITQEQLSMLNLDGGLSPLAVVFGLFLGVSVILVMIVCIMHATKPKKRDGQPLPGQQSQTPGLDKDGDDECVQVI